MLFYYQKNYKNYLFENMINKLLKQLKTAQIICNTIVI